MLLYHPSKDANHTCYRIISILESVPENKIHKNILSLINFYYLFPSQLKAIEKWPRKGSNDYNFIHSLKPEYEIMENPRRIFFELKDVLDCAVSFLIDKQIINYENNDIKLNVENIPKNINVTLNNDDFRKDNLFRILTHEIIKQNIKGSNGLKMKTGLMEYKYD